MSIKLSRPFISNSWFHQTDDRCASHSVDLGGSLVKLFALDVLDKAVEFLLGVFILVSLPGHSDSDLAWHVSDALEPNVSVQLGVNANVLRVMRKNNQLTNTRSHGEYN